MGVKRILSPKNVQKLNDMKNKDDDAVPKNLCIKKNLIKRSLCQKYVSEAILKRKLCGLKTFIYKIFGSKILSVH